MDKSSLALTGALENIFAGRTLFDSIGDLTGYLTAALEVGNHNTPEVLLTLSGAFNHDLACAVDHVKGMHGLSAAEEPGRVQEAIMRAQNAALMEMGCDEGEERDWEDQLEGTIVRRVFTSWADDEETIRGQTLTLTKLERLFALRLPETVIDATAAFVAFQLQVSGKATAASVDYISKLCSRLLQSGSETAKDLRGLLAPSPGLRERILAGLRRLGIRWRGERI